VSDPVEYVRIIEGEPLPDIAAHAPFRAVVIIDASYSQDWQNEVSVWLVASGCLYMMAWGEGCSSWDDSVDWANIDRFAYLEIPADEFVMTTWHEQQKLDDVFWEAHFAADHGDVALGCSLIVDISAVDRRDEMLSRFLAARDQPCD